MQPEVCTIPHARMRCWLPWNGQRGARACEDQTIALKQIALALPSYARKLPACTIHNSGNSLNFSNADINLNPGRHPLDIAGPLAMGRSRAPAVHPVRIGSLVNQIGIPGEQIHLFINGLVQWYASPKCGSIREADILLRARPQQLSAIGKASRARPVSSHALIINDDDPWDRAPQLCEHSPLSGNRNSLRPSANH